MVQYDGYDIGTFNIPVEDFVNLNYVYINAGFLIKCPTLLHLGFTLQLRTEEYCSDDFFVCYFRLR